MSVQEESCQQSPVAVEAGVPLHHVAFWRLAARKHSEDRIRRAWCSRATATSLEGEVLCFATPLLQEESKVVARVLRHLANRLAQVTRPRRSRLLRHVSRASRSGTVPHVLRAPCLNPPEPMRRSLLQPACPPECD